MVARTRAEREAGGPDVGSASGEELEEDALPSVVKNGAMSGVLTDLEALLRDRLEHRPDGSYAASLFADPERIQRKIMEEAFEVCLELGRAELRPERVASEAADLLFHLLVGLVHADVRFDEVTDELEGRRR